MSAGNPVPGAARTLPVDRLHEALGDPLVVVLALALTSDTERIIGASELAAMPESAWLVNVARGQTRWEDLDTWITPNGKFFSIAHYNRPVIDETAWRSCG